MELTAFNPMLVPAAFVRVNEGRIKSLAFDFTYDESNSTGSLDLQYENLDISLLDKEDGSQKTFKTFITETFVLSKENLKEINRIKRVPSQQNAKKRNRFLITGGNHSLAV
jgi:hypothetical protein